MKLKIKVRILVFKKVNSLNCDVFLLFLKQNNSIVCHSFLSKLNFWPWDFFWSMRHRAQSTDVFLDGLLLIEKNKIKSLVVFSFLAAVASLKLLIKNIHHISCGCDMCEVFESERSGMLEYNFHKITLLDTYKVKDYILFWMTLVWHISVWWRRRFYLFC